MSHNPENTYISEIVRAFVNQLQAVENAAQGVYLLTRLENAVGKQIDGIGEIVGEARLARDDAEYKTAIYFRIFLNSSNGEPETLISVIRSKTQSTDIHFREYAPAHVRIEFNGTVVPETLLDTMQGLAPVGINLSLVSTSFDNMFAFAGTSSGLGFGTISDPMVGGHFSHLL